MPQNNTSSLLLSTKPPHHPSSHAVSKTGSKLAEIQESLKEMFLEQQRGYNNIIPHKPMKMEKDHSPPKREQQPEKQPQLTRKNMELFQAQQQQQQQKEKKRDNHNREKENVQQNKGHDSNPPMTQLDGQRKLHHNRPKMDVHDLEMAKLRNTIATYEGNTNNLMKTLCSERECYRVATRDLERTNEILRNDVARIEKSFRDVLSKREDELQLNERFRRENDELLNKSLRLQHDLSQALGTIERSEQLISDMRETMEKRRTEKEVLVEQNRELELQLDRVRSTMSAWTACTETGPDRSMGQTVSCAVAKVVFFGSVVAVGLAAVLQVVQASPEVDCDYVREALND